MSRLLRSWVRLYDEREGRRIDSDVLHDRPHLDRAVRDRLELVCPGDRGVERVGLDQVVAAELFLRLGERPVRDQLLAALQADGLRRLDGLEWRAAHVRPGLLQRS